jgi:hypothetical protein
MRELEFLRDELQIKVTDLEETVKKVCTNFSGVITDICFGMCYRI